MIPIFGRMSLASISSRDVGHYLSRIRERSSGANSNRHWSVLSKIFSLGMQFQIVEKNPCKAIKKFPESSGRERYLYREELQSFLAALDGYGDSVSALALRFLLFTGLRRGEALQTKWDDIDLATSTLHIHMDRAKSGKSRHVVLNTLAMEVIYKMKTLKVTGNPYVFPGVKPGAHLHDARGVFETIREDLGIPDFRIHDLRYCFAAMCVQSGSSLYAVQRLLGHQSPQMTSRYAHIGDDAMRSASESMVSEIEEAIG